MKTASVLSSPLPSLRVLACGSAPIDSAERTFYWHFWTGRGNFVRVRDSAAENSMAPSTERTDTETDLMATALLLIVAGAFCSFPAVEVSARDELR